MSFRKLFKKLCVFGSVASLALGLFTGSAKADAPGADELGKPYGHLSSEGFINDQTTENIAITKNLYDRLFPNLKINSQILMNSSVGNDSCFLSTKTDDVSNEAIGKAVELYSWDTSNNKWVKSNEGNVSSDSRDIYLYMRAEKGEGQERVNTGWYKVVGQNYGSNTLTICPDSNDDTKVGYYKFKAPSSGTWKLYYYIDGGTLYPDSSAYSN